VIPPWDQLSDRERTVFSAAVSFLSKRLAERDTIDWALKLKPTQRIERLTIKYLLDDPGAQAIAEPWATSWRLIEESWSNAPVEQGPSLEVHRIRRRLAAGDRSGSIVSAITNLVAPRLDVEPIGAWRWEFEKKPRRPKTFNDLLSVRLTSGQLVDLEVLGLEKLEEIPFLVELAHSLDAAVTCGLNAAKRTGWTDSDSRLLVGSPNRVYYMQRSRRVGGEEEPDAYHRGIAPSVKLLHAVVSRIAELDAKASLPFVHSWRVSSSPLCTRLWAAIARSSHLVSAQDVAAFLQGLDDHQFWSLSDFPEIAELRARRFSGLAPDAQKSTASRIRRGPPRNLWLKKADSDQVRTAKRYWIVRELKRLEIAGGGLERGTQAWLMTKINEFPDLASMKIDSDFPEGPSVRWVSPNPDSRYETLRGTGRLRALERFPIIRSHILQRRSSFRIPVA